jgi:hypothetical protein
MLFDGRWAALPDAVARLSSQTGDCVTSPVTDLGIASRRIKDQFWGSGVLLVEIKHPHQRASNRIGRLVAEPTEMPIVFNEPHHGRLVRHIVVDEVPSCPWPDHDKRLPRAIVSTRNVCSSSGLEWQPCQRCRLGMASAPADESVTGISVFCDCRPKHRLTIHARRWAARMFPTGVSVARNNKLNRLVDPADSTGHAHIWIERFSLSPHRSRHGFRKTPVVHLARRPETAR